MSKLIPPRDDEEEAAIRPMTLDMYYFWNSETYTLTETEERTLNQLIYEGLPPRIPVDHVKREVRKRLLRFRVSYPPEFHHLFTESDSG